MNIKELRVHFHVKEPSTLTIWADCNNEKDVRHLIEVLQIAQRAMVDWDNSEDRVE